MSSISRILCGAFVCLALSSCSLFYNPDNHLSSGGPQQRIYYADFGRVWIAAQKTIGNTNYPVKVNNMDLGLLETGDIEGYNKYAWHPPHKNKKSRGGLRYMIRIRIVKGNVQGNPAVKVTVYKKLLLQSDFFADEQNMSSNGLEEKTILYRIQRELDMDLALKRVQDRINNETPDLIGD